MNQPDGGGKPMPNSSKSRPATELFIDHLIRMEISNQLKNGISAETTTVAAIQESTPYLNTNVTDKMLPSNENQQRDKLPWSQQCLNYLVQELSSGRKPNRIIKDTCPDSELTDKDVNILDNDLTNKKELSVTNRVDDPNEQYTTSLNLFKNDMTPLNLVNDMTPLNLVKREKTHQETNKSVNGKQHLPPANTKDGLPSQTNNLITIEGSAEMSSTFVDQDTQSKDNIVIGDKGLTPQDPSNTELAVKKEASFNEMPVASLESEFPDMTTKETTEKNSDVSPEYEAPLAVSTASLGDEDDPKTVSSVTHGSINSTECNEKTDAKEAFGSKDTKSNGGQKSGETNNMEGKLENKSVRDMTHMNTLIHKAIDQCLIREAVDEFNRMVEAAMSKKEGRGQLLAGNDDIESTSSKSPSTAADDDSECNDLMKYTKIVEGNNGSVSYICTKCKISFPHMTDLHMHTFTHFRRKHRCPACKKEFYNLSSVKRHMIIHTRLKPFKCPRCARAFNLHTNLRKHFQRMHDAKLPGLSRREVARNTIQFNKGSNVNRILNNWRSSHAIETPRAQGKYVQNTYAATRDATSSSNALMLLPGHTESIRMQPNPHISPPILQGRLPPPALQDRLHQGSTLSDQTILPLTNSPLQQQQGEPASQSINTGLSLHQDYFNSYQNDQPSPISPANVTQSERRMPSLGQISEHNLQANMITDRRFIPSVPAENILLSRLPKTDGDITSRGVCKCPDCPQSIYKRSHDNVQQTDLSDMQSPRLTTTPHQRGQIFDSNDNYPRSKYITSAPPPPYQLTPSVALHPTATPANARNPATLSPTNLGISSTNLRMSPNTLRMSPNTLRMNPNNLRMNQTNLRMSPNTLRMNPNNLGMSQNTLRMNPNNLGMSQTNLRMSPNTVRMSPNMLRMNPTNLPHTSSPSIIMTNSTITTPDMGMDITNTRTVTNLGMSATNLGTSVTNPRIDMTNTGSMLMNNNGMHMPNLGMSPINPIGVPNSQPSPSNPQMSSANFRIGLSNSTMSRPNSTMSRPNSTMSQPNSTMSWTNSNSIHGWDITEKEFTEMAAKMTSPESRSWLLEQQRIKHDNALIHNWKASAQHQSRQLPVTPDPQLPNISNGLPNQQTPNKTALMSEQDTHSRMAPILRPSKFPRIQSFDPSKINIYKLQQALMLENKTNVQSNPPSLCTTPHQSLANGWNTIDSNQRLKKQPEIPLRASKTDIRQLTELVRDYEHAQPHKTLSLDPNMNIVHQDDSPMDLSKK